MHVELVGRMLATLIKIARVHREYDVCSQYECVKPYAKKTYAQV